MSWSLIKKMFHRQKMELQASGRTDTGRKRNRNEDSFCVMPNRSLFIVADGMGGHNAGDVASENAVNFLADYLIENKIEQLAGNQSAIRHLMVSAFNEVNFKIMALAGQDAKLSGMGCTLIACFIDRNLAHFCHVGDVRGYLATPTTIRQITTDHTFAAEFEENNTIINGQPKPPKNIVNRAIGFPLPKDPEYNSAELQAGCKVLLCSDGLWGMLDDEVIHQIITSTDNADQACNNFIEKANEAGGKDNITAVSIFI